MDKKKFPVFSIVFYVLAGLFFIYSVWAAVFSFNYIGDMIAQNQLVIDGNLFEIISFHMSNFAQYLVYALVLFGLGWIVQVLTLEEVEFVLVDDEEDEQEDALEDSSLSD